MRKIGASQAERLVVLHSNPTPLAQFLAALGALRVAADDEHNDVFGFTGWSASGFWMRLGNAHLDFTLN